MKHSVSSRMIISVVWIVNMIVIYLLTSIFVSNEAVSLVLRLACFVIANGCIIRIYFLYLEYDEEKLRVEYLDQQVLYQEENAASFQATVLEMDEEWNVKLQLENGSILWVDRNKFDEQVTLIP